MFKRYSRGIGLLEVMLSIAIIALVVVMSARYFSTVREQQKITQTLQMATTVLQAAHTWGAGQTSFPTSSKGLLTALVNAGLLPAAYTSIRNPWGGQFDLTGFGDGSILTFIFDGIGKTTICDILKEKLITPPPIDPTRPRFGDVTRVQCA